MKRTLTLLPALLFAFGAFAQAPEIGTPGWAAQHPSDQSVTRQAGPQFSPQNGNDTLTTLYNNSACGLNYTTASVRLGQRFQPAGLPQPAPMTVMMPACAVIDKAYLYTEALGVTPAITANLTNPSSQSTSYNMSLIGSSVDVCWGMNGTHVWRADVTASITGPGTYTISGLPTDPTATSTTVDVEGATLVIIYTDPYASFTGTLILDDGCHTVTGGSLTHTMTGFSACANSTAASSFMLVGDMQMMGYNITMNGNNVTQPMWDWWNEISAPTNVTNGQGSCTFTMNDLGDCYTLAAAGLYYQTPCQSCTPAISPLSATTTINAATCLNNGSASVSVTGGNGNYTYLWLPTNQTTATATNLMANTYTVYITDGSNCTSATVTVPYNGMTLATTVTPATCNSGGTATVSISGGTGPFTYQWSNGDTTATATNLNPGYVTVYVTDQATGCTLSSGGYINSTAMSVSSWSSPATCSASNGSVYCNVSGGAPPYTVLWQPGNYTTYTVNNLPAGTYTLSVTDSTGCTTTNSVTVGSTGNGGLSIFGGGTYSCGDSIVLYASCNDPNATYSWSPAATLTTPNSAWTGCNAMTTTTYTVTVNSSCGILTDTVTVNVGSVNQHVEEICFVTIDTSLNKNIVIWERWNSPVSGSYNIYRETSVSGVYALVGSQPISQFSTFIDMTSNPQVMANRYVITTVDTCGVESDTSYHHRTIHLQTTPTGNGGWNLAWTAYEGLPIATYNIYRGTSISTLTLLTQVAGNVFTYTDLAPPAGQNYYMIEAVHPFGGCNPARMAAGSGNFSPLEYSSALSNISIATPNGMENLQLENSLQLTPNPGIGTFQLSMTLGLQQPVTVTVFDNTGRNIYAQQVAATAGPNVVSMDLSSLSAGTYLVQVKTENGTAVRRLVIQ